MTEHRYPWLRQAVLNLGEDTLVDFDDEYQATEDWVAGWSDARYRELVSEIDLLMASTSDALTRMKQFRYQYGFDVDHPEDFDLWLGLLRQRAAEALAGIHNPMVDPDPHPRSARMEPDDLDVSERDASGPLGG
jgi:hypothetical protein